MIYPNDKELIHACLSLQHTYCNALSFCDCIFCYITHQCNIWLWNTLNHNLWYNLPLLWLKVNDTVKCNNHSRLMPQFKDKFQKALETRHTHKFYILEIISGFQITSNDLGGRDHDQRLTWMWYYTKSFPSVCRFAQTFFCYALEKQAERFLLQNFHTVYSSSNEYLQLDVDEVGTLKNHIN